MKNESSRLKRRRAPAAGRRRKPINLEALRAERKRVSGALHVRLLQAFEEAGDIASGCGRDCMVQEGWAAVPDAHQSGPAKGDGKRDEKEVKGVLCRAQGNQSQNPL
jgi:hypothetical protein